MSRNKENRKADLQAKLKNISKSTNKQTASEILRIKNTLLELENSELEGLRIRSKMEWAEKSERPNKLFFNIEKQQGKEKEINSLVNEKGNIVSTKEEVLTCAEK